MTWVRSMNDDQAPSLGTYRVIERRPSAAASKRTRPELNDSRSDVEALILEVEVPTYP